MADQWKQESSSSTAVMEENKEKGREQVEWAGDQLADFTSRHKDSWSHKLDTVVHALHETAQSCARRSRNMAALRLWLTMPTARPKRLTISRTTLRNASHAT